jgi:ATP-dependent DNA ligase
VKHDGFRTLAHIDGHRRELRSRNGHMFEHWPQLCEEVAHAVKAHDTVIDVEIVCLDRWRDRLPGSMQAVAAVRNYRRIVSRRTLLPGGVSLASLRR